MKNSKKKNAFIASGLSMLLCIAMLVGTTFAWFTDTASTGVNKIQAGNLDIEIVDANSNALNNLAWVDNAGTSQEAILWEPGAAYRLTPFKIVNKGSLALKYQIVITDGITTRLDATSTTSAATSTTAVTTPDLLDVIDFYVFTDAIVSDANGRPDLSKAKSLEKFCETEGSLTAEEASTMIYIVAKMKESAGNEYQGLALEGMTITVCAAQETHETDSFDDQYDANAEYFISVSTQAELDEAMTSGKVHRIIIKEGAELEIDGTTYESRNPGTAIENHGELTITGAEIYTTEATAQGRHAITNYGTLTVENSTLGSTQSRGNAIRNYGTATVKNSELTCCDNYLNGGYAYVFASSAGTLTVENCTYVGAANGVFAADGGAITINGGSYKLTGASSWHMFYMVNGTITVNSGTFEKSGNDKGMIGGNDKLTINGGTFTYNGASWSK